MNLDMTKYHALNYHQIMADIQMLKTCTCTDICSTIMFGHVNWVVVYPYVDLHIHDHLCILTAPLHVENLPMYVSTVSLLNALQI